MTTRRGSRRSRGARAPRASTVWTNQGSISQNLAAGAEGIFDLLSLARLPATLEGGLTVLRMILRLGVRAQASNTTPLGAFGVSVVTRDAFSGLAVPDPLTDLVDWYLWHGFAMFDSDSAGREWNFDIRTARRLRGEDRTLVAVMEADATSSALTWDMDVRLLCRRS